MKRLLGWYGAGPLHLLSLLACFALAGYAAAQLVPSRPLGVAVWFVGAVIGHDLLLVPLYSLADRSAVAVIRHRASALPTVAWINYVRVPAALSALLLLVWFPLIFRLTAIYHASTTLSPDPYVWHWLAVTGALFLLSAVALAVRLRGTREHALPEEGDNQARSAEEEGAQAAGMAPGTASTGDGPGREVPSGDEGSGREAPGGEGAAGGQGAAAGERPSGDQEPSGDQGPVGDGGPIPDHPQEAAAGPGPQPTAADPRAAGAVRDQPGRSVPASEADLG